jgi:hypothetical protein
MLLSIIFHAMIVACFSFLAAELQDGPGQDAGRLGGFGTVAAYPTWLRMKKTSGESLLKISCRGKTVTLLDGPGRL